CDSALQLQSCTATHCCRTGSSSKPGRALDVQYSGTHTRRSDIAVPTEQGPRSGTCFGQATAGRTDNARHTPVAGSAKRQAESGAGNCSDIGQIECAAVRRNCRRAGQTEQAAVIVSPTDID